MNYDLLSLLLLGISLGLPSGLSPGPMTGLVISETLKHGTKEGVKISFAPLVTDTPIVILSVFILANFSDIDLFLGIVTLLGAAFLLYLAYENFTIKHPDIIDVKESAIKPFRKAVITNFLNASPYIFWISIGGRILVEGYEQTRLGTLLFLVTFYICLISTKLILAYLSGKMKSFFKGNGYLWTIRVMGVLLLALSVVLFIDAFDKFDI